MRSALLALAAVLAVSGCAGSTLSPQRDAVGTVTTFLTQCSRDRPLAVMQTLVPAAQHEFLAAGRTRDGCARVLGTRALHPGVAHLRSFNGSQAVVLVRGGGGPRALGGGFLGNEGGWLEPPPRSTPPPASSRPA